MLNSNYTMKHVKLFEQFLNEANELILAQGACKNAIFMAQKSVDGLLKKLLSSGIVTKAKSKVDVYNRGYELNINIDYDWRSLGGPETHSHDNKASFLNTERAKKAVDIQETIGILHSTIWIQPESFFESRLMEDGKSSIESKVFKMDRNMNYDEQYPRYIVKSKADIKKVSKEYANLIKAQVEEITKTLGL